MILTPTTTSSAFEIGDEAMKKNPIAMWLNDIFTVSVSLAGLPALSLPIGLDKKGLIEVDDSAPSEDHEDGCDCGCDHDFVELGDVEIDDSPTIEDENGFIEV